MEKTDILRQKYVSLPTFSKKPKEMLTSNISAPFDLYCMKNSMMKKDYKFSPFTKPVLDLKPHLLINSILNVADVVNIIKILQDSNKNQLLAEYLVKKDIVNQLHGTENNFLTLLFLETIDYAAQKDFTAFKLTCLLNIYISTHNYMKSKIWRQPKEIWDYFKEVLIRLTIEDSPDGQEVFSPDESYDILSHFHTIYMNNLPLIHILVFGVHRLRLVWPFN